MGKVLVMIIILGVSIYTLSFAVYNWKNGNRKASVGVILLTLISVVFPVILMFFRG